MSANTSRNRGHKFERDCARKLREIGYTDVRCSRECSRLRDSKKVDLCNADEDEYGRLPFNFQCKSYSSVLNYTKLLAELEEHNGRKQVNIVLHQHTVKSTKGKFMTKGEYVILEGKDFSMLYSSSSVREYLQALVVSTRVHSLKSRANYVKMLKEEPSDILSIMQATDDRPNMLVLMLPVFWEILTHYIKDETRNIV